MVDDILEIGHDLDDEQAVMQEIERTIDDQRRELRLREYHFSPQSRGVLMPFLVNVGAVVFSALAVFALWHLFLGVQESYVLRSGSLGEQGADIVAALLAEARASLESRDSRIAAIETEITSLDTRIAELNERIAALAEELRHAPEEERDRLVARRNELAGELAREVEARDQLRAQVALQERAAGAGGAVQEDPLQVLREHQQLADLFQRQLQARYRGVTDALGVRNYNAAEAELEDLDSFLRENRAIEAVPMLQQERLLHIALGTRLRELIVAVRDGSTDDPEDDADEPPAPVAGPPPDVLPGWDRLRNDLSAAQQLIAQGRQDEAVARFEAVISEIPGLSGGMGLITTRAEERSANQLSMVLDEVELQAGDDPEMVLRSISAALGEREDQFPAGIQRLATRLQDAVVVVEEQQRELNELTATAVAQLALLQQALGEDAVHQSGAQSAGVAGERETASSIAARIEELRLQAVQREAERQALSRQLRDQQRDHQAELAAVTEELSRRVAELEDFRRRITGITDRYSAAVPAVRRGIANGSRTALYEVFVALLAPFEADRTGEFFPDISILMRTAVESLIAQEAQRAAALAEEQLLTEMMVTSERIAEEQVRLLARGSSITDSMELLDSLIREIDTIAQTARDERQDSRAPRPMGTVVEARRDGVITVRRALEFPVRSVRRLYFSRVLPNGDRVPIGEGEIVASAGENMVLRVVSTIAPTIFPEVNDVVYVEF